MQLPVGTDRSFPWDGVNSGTGINRVNATTFNLEKIGVYPVRFSVVTNEAGQLVLTLNGDDLDDTLTGRARCTSALTITPYSGSPNPVTAHLIILRLA